MLNVPWQASVTFPIASVPFHSSLTRLPGIKGVDAITRMQLPAQSTARPAAIDSGSESAAKLMA